MSSRDEILSAIRRQNVPAESLPDLHQNWITYSDPIEQFRITLESVGGRFIAVENPAEANRVLASLPVCTEAKQTLSLVPGIGAGNIDLNSIADPHALETVDFVVSRGEFAVAENGAIWVSGADIKHRAILFICQHLAIVVPADQVLHNMHQAYERLSFPQPSFGAFISGPSKTADIEQSLVIGAHGPRSLTVLCCKEIF